MDKARKKRQEKRQAEKEQELERQRYRASQNTRGKMAIRKSRTRRRITVAIIVVAIIGVLVWSLYDIVSLKREQIQIKKEQEMLLEEKATLEKELEEINNPENVEEQARDQLRLIKPGEILYLFPEEIMQYESQEGEETPDE